MQADLSPSRGITFDQVRDAVERLTEEDRPISSGTIREALGGTGSKTTILRHLATLREQQGTPGHIDTSGIAENVVQILAKEVARVAGERTAHLSQRLEEAQSGVLSLIEDNEDLTAELRTSCNSLEDAQRTIAVQVGVERELRARLATLSQQHTEIESLRHELARCDAERKSLKERLSEAGDALTRAEARAQQLMDGLLHNSERR